eukprot:Lankesteria_metandrocarpae@DN4041_c0_g1_i1.p1
MRRSLHCCAVVLAVTVLSAVAVSKSSFNSTAQCEDTLVLINNRVQNKELQYHNGVPSANDVQDDAPGHQLPSANGVQDDAPARVLGSDLHEWTAETPELQYAFDMLINLGIVTSTDAVDYAPVEFRNDDASVEFRYDSAPIKFESDRYNYLKKIDMRWRNLGLLATLAIEVSDGTTSHVGAGAGAVDGAGGADDGEDVYYFYGAAYVPGGTLADPVVGYKEAFHLRNAEAIYDELKKLFAKTGRYAVIGYDEANWALPDVVPDTVAVDSDPKRDVAPPRSSVPPTSTAHRVTMSTAASVLLVCSTVV